MLPCASAFASFEFNQYLGNDCICGVVKSDTDSSELFDHDSLLSSTFALISTFHFDLCISAVCVLCCFFCAVVDE